MAAWFIKTMFLEGSLLLGYLLPAPPNLPIRSDTVPGFLGVFFITPFTIGSAQSCIRRQSAIGVEHFNYAHFIKPGKISALSKSWKFFRKSKLELLGWIPKFFNLLFLTPPPTLFSFSRFLSYNREKGGDFGCEFCRKGFIGLAL